MAKRVRDVFRVDDSIVTAIPSTALTDGTSQIRYRAWRRAGGSDGSAREYLLPRVEVEVTRRWPDSMTPKGHRELSRTDLEERVRDLGPWGIPFRLDHGVVTVEDAVTRAVAEQRFLYRLDLINGVVTNLLGADLAGTRVLDIGCNCGLFSLDLAGKGAGWVDGVDLRPENVERARFLADHYGLANTAFEVGDADDMSTDAEWDVVLNLGVLYHVQNPFGLIRRTYELCRSFAVIDTVCHTEPVSAYFVMGDKDVTRAGEGKDAYELHPTYRAAVDTIIQAGFVEVFEVVGHADVPHDLYASGARRCFLAIK